MTLEEVFIRIVAGEEEQDAARRRVRADGGGGDALKRWLPVFKKEMRLYFTSPVAYVVFTFFLLITGWFFSQIFLFYSDASMQSAMNPQMGQNLNVTDNVMRPLFSNMSVVLLFFMPLLTMRLFAEEKKSGTIELLLTYPVRDGAVLAGKYLAALALYVILLGLTLLYPGPRRVLHPRRVGADPHRLPRAWS